MNMMPMFKLTASQFSLSSLQKGLLPDTSDQKKQKQKTYRLIFNNKIIKKN